MTSVRCVRRSRVCVCVCVCGLFRFFLLTRPPNPRSRISSKREGEARLRDPFLPSQPRILTCAADDGPCLASFSFSFRERERYIERANVEIRPSRIARAREGEEERAELGEDRAISRARARSGSTLPRGTRVAPFSRRAVDSKGSGRKFSNSGPSSRLTCFRRAIRVTPGASRSARIVNRRRVSRPRARRSGGVPRGDFNRRNLRARWREESRGREQPSSSSSSSSR